jgi:PAS domain S-box-containing protein
MLTADQEKLIEFIKSKSPDVIPIGNFVIDPEGYLVVTDDITRSILNIADDSSSAAKQPNVKNYYPTSNDVAWTRDRIIDNEKKGIFWEAQLTYFNVNVKFPVFTRTIIKWVIFFYRTIRSDNDDIKGFFGRIIDVSGEVIFHRVCDLIEVPFYSLDDNDNIIKVNDPFLRLFGYSKPKELQKQPVNILYVESNDAQSFRRKVENSGKVLFDSVPVKRQDGSRFFSSASAICKYKYNSGSYEGRYGVITDLTAYEIAKVFKDVPVGTFIVRVENNKEVIWDCNDEFARMFVYKKETLRDFPAEKLHENLSTYAKYRATIKQGKLFKAPGVPAKKSTGQIFPVDVYGSNIKAPNHDDGRTGIIFDVTERFNLRKIRNDVGILLHLYSQAVSPLTHSLEYSMSFLGLSPFSLSEEITPDKIIGHLKFQIKDLNDKLLSFLLFADKDELMLTLLSRETFADLRYLNKMLSDYNNKIKYIELQVIFFANASITIRKICETNFISKGYLNPIITSLKDAAFKVEKLCCIISLHQRLYEIEEMSHQAKIFSEFIKYGEYEEEPIQDYLVIDIIKNVISNLSDYANYKVAKGSESAGVRIIDHFESIMSDKYQILIKVDKRKVTRALCNLLHNAIKYSWNRDKSMEKQQWVDINIEYNNELVFIRFHNYGVAISQDEITSGILFELGYRGIYSGDRGRIGTGVGLTDAMQTAKLYGGNIEIESRPAIRSGQIIHYENTPFITTVTMVLPVIIKYREV